MAAGGKAQATVQASSKLYTLIQATGEFSIEAWVAPALVAATTSYMVSYSGGDTLRNFTLVADQPRLRLHPCAAPTPDLNGMPQLQTPDAAMALQAALQHVVLTYDPVNGRQIYRERRQHGRPRPAEGRHHLATGTPPSPWCSATRSPATMPGRA